MRKEAVQHHKYFRAWTSNFHGLTKCKCLLKSSAADHPAIRLDVSKGQLTALFAIAA